MSKYGCITPKAKGREFPVAASQYFKDGAGAFVLLDSSGNVILALTASATLLGYAVPSASSMGAGTTVGTWKSSATAGADKIFVITDLDAEFIVPDAGATIAGSDRGNTCDLIGVNDGTAQTADQAHSSTKVLIIQDLGTKYGSQYGATDVVVKINPAKRQAD